MAVSNAQTSQKKKGCCTSALAWIKPLINKTDYYCTDWTVESHEHTVKNAAILLSEDIAIFVAEMW